MSLERRKVGAGPWLTVQADEGGGGDLPDWWTVVSTPGSESVEFGGAAGVLLSGSGIEVDDTGDSGKAIQVYGSVGYASLQIGRLEVQSQNGASPVASFSDTDGTPLLAVGPTGAVTISPSAAVQPLNIATANGGTVVVGEFGGVGITPGTGAGADNALIVSSEEGLADLLVIQADGKIGFFGASPIVKPTSVAVTAGGIHAALVDLGLIAA